MTNPIKIDVSNLIGTALQKKVWAELQNIPAGTTLTYSQLAEKVGHPKAIRAVASAVGKNPCAPQIPCHRIIRSDGSLGGYSGTGGIERKRALLKEEGVVL